MAAKKKPIKGIPDAGPLKIIKPDGTVKIKNVNRKEVEKTIEKGERKKSKMAQVEHGVYIETKPIPKGRPRMTRRGRVFTPITTLHAEGIIAEAWTAQVAEAKGKYADFDQVALANDLTVTKAMGELIMTSDAGPDVLYYLGQNRALAAQIAAMNPAEAARVIGRIEERVMSQAPKPRTETKAPAPINPVRGSAGASRNPENMSYVEWVKWRENGGKVT